MDLDQAFPVEIQKSVLEVSYIVQEVYEINQSCMMVRSDKDSPEQTALHCTMLSFVCLLARCSGVTGE